MLGRIEAVGGVVAIGNPADDVVTGPRLRHRDDVGLGVVTDPDGEELHQLSGEVLVGAPRHVGLVVEVHEHGRALRRREQQTGEVVERECANHVAIIDRLEDADRILLMIDVEMIRPESDHAFEELPFRMHGANDRRLNELCGDGSRYSIAQLRDVEPQSVERREALIERSIFNRQMIELFFEKCVVADVVDPRDVFRLRTERDALQQAKIDVIRHGGRRQRNGRDRIAVEKRRTGGAGAERGDKAAPREQHWGRHACWISLAGED